MNDRLVRLLLLLYPRDQRRRFGDEMRQMMRSRVSCRPFRPKSRALFLLRDTIRAVPEAHLRIWIERLGLAPKPAPFRRGKSPVQSTKKESRSRVNGVARDLRYAMRSLLKSPGFTATAIAAFAVGIGANAAIFSLVYSVLIHPLPFAEPEQLVIVEGTSPERGLERVPFSYPDFKDLERLSESFSDLAAVWQVELLLTSEGSSTMLNGAYISANLTDMLGVAPLAGSGFMEAEGQPQMALIGEGLWRSRFGGEPGVVGTTIVLDGTEATVAGVLPRIFRFPEAAEVWVLLAEERLGSREHKHLSLVGRLKGGIERQQAEVELNQVASGLAELYPETNGDVGVRVRSLRAGIFGDQEQPVLVFYAVACLVMLLACANVASLFLARNESRRAELAVRISLGAGWRRLVQFVLAESVIISVIGGVLGVAVGWYGRDLVLALRTAGMPYYLLPEVRIDVILLIAGIVILTGLLTGLAPAIAAARAVPSGLGHAENKRHSNGIGRSRFNAAIVSVEVALALVVLIGTNLMVKSALNQRSLNPGFSPQDVATLRLQLPEGRLFQRLERWNYYREVLEAIRSHPMVTSAAVVSRLPSDYVTDPWPIVAEGNALSGSGLLPQYLYRLCDGDYFSTMRIPLLRGRTFEDSDGQSGAAAVAIVSATFAEQFWPGQDAVGKRLAFGDVPTEGDGLWMTVVGVVGDTYNVGYGRTVEPAVYTPWSDFAPRRAHVVARMTANAGDGFPILRERILAVDSEALIWGMRTMEQAMFETHWQLRFYSWGLSVFSAIALILASTGVYGVVSYAITRRLREYAIRMAVGADAREILGSVARRNLAMTAIGVAGGLLLALAAMRFLSGMLFRVNPLDIGVYGVSTGLLIGAALVAGYIPVRRLFRIEPMAVLNKS